MKTQTQTSHAMHDQLHTALQQTFTLYRATHMAHWNVRGPHFPQLHALFEQQYNELWIALDAIAERIRAIGSSVSPDALAGPATEDGADARQALHQLAASHRAFVAKLRSMEGEADAAGDPGTCDLFTQRILAHDQMAWMLEATVEGMA